MTQPEQPTQLPSVDEIRSLVEQGQIDEAGLILATFHPADIADLLDELPPEEAVLLFGLLNLEVASEVLDETGSVVRQELVERVDDERLADLLDERRGGLSGRAAARHGGATARPDGAGGSSRRPDAAGLRGR